MNSTAGSIMRTNEKCRREERRIERRPRSYRLRLIARGCSRVPSRWLTARKWNVKKCASTGIKIFLAIVNSETSRCRFPFSTTMVPRGDIFTINFSWKLAEARGRQFFRSSRISLYFHFPNSLARETYFPAAGYFDGEFPREIFHSLMTRDSTRIAHRKCRRFGAGVISAGIRFRSSVDGKPRLTHDA